MRLPQADRRVFYCFQPQADRVDLPFEYPSVQPQKEVVNLHDAYERRCKAIRLRLTGAPVRQIVSEVHASETWFYKWWGRYQCHGSAGLYDSSHRPHRVAHKTSPELESAVLHIRDRLEGHHTDQTRYSLIGAPTIRAELEELGYHSLPALRTIEGILQRAGRTKPRKHTLLAPPVKEYPGPKARDSNQVHQLDLVGPRYLEANPTKFYYITVKDIFDQAGYVGVSTNRQAQTVVEVLVRAWQALGLPKVLQVDNAWEFRGSARWPRSLGKVIRLCLMLRVELFFIPEGKPCRNGSVENRNGLLNQLFIKAQKFEDLEHIQRELERFNEAINTQHVHKALEYKTPFQVRQGKQFNKLEKEFEAPQHPMPICAGKVSFIRQVRPSGRITLLGEKFQVGKRLKGQFVKATIFTKTEKLKIYLKGHIVKEWPYKLRK